VDAGENYDDVMRLAEDRNIWRKMTHQPSDTKDGIMDE